MKTIPFILFLVWAAVDLSETASCSSIYFPCNCFADPNNNIYVNCYDVSIEEVRDMFQRANESQIYHLELNNIDSAIPEGFLGNTTVTNDIGIYFNNYESEQNLVIHPLAFTISQNSTLNFYIGYCNLGSQKDFSFLDGFSKLEQIQLRNTREIEAFQYLPPLPSLETLTIISGINNIVFPDLSPAKLKTLNFGENYTWIAKPPDNYINDETADGIVSSLINSTSAGSLTTLNFNYNYLTRIPKQIGNNFPQLKYLYLGRNYIWNISSSSLAFVSPHLEILELSYNQIETIESGAFKGNFTQTQVNLPYNRLTTFEEGVFKEMLQQMMTDDSKSAYVNVFGNQFECGCDVAWLIRDNRHLLPAVKYGQCATNSLLPSEKFEFVDPRYFAFCPKSSSSKSRMELWIAILFLIAIIRLS